MSEEGPLSAVDVGKSSIHLFQSKERLELLNDIDRFREYGLDDLPQIVVVGDTSSGKSSVLEALSGVAFPRDAGICTQFATELALRFSTQKEVTGQASITPWENSTATHRDNAKRFHRNIRNLQDDVAQVIQDAKKEMGVENGGISRDVLHLKLEGQSLPNLTLVDLPGLIHASGRSNDDIAAVTTLARFYAEKKQSIVMAVVSAEVVIENQIVLTMSREIEDSTGKIVGVITKPDELDRGKKSLIPAIVKLAENENQRFSFKRPWHLVRCLSDDERARGEVRSDLEFDTLSKAPWNGLTHARLGINQLRDNLCEYLESHIVEGLDSLTDLIEQRIAATKKSLDGLGEIRSTSEQQRNYLTRLSRQYERLVDAALCGSYRDNSFFHPEDGKTRLRATMMEEADLFEKTMQEIGHSYEIRTPAPIDVNTKKVMHPKYVTKSEILSKVGRLLKEYRGSELPLLFNPDLVATLFREQSVNWVHIAAKYANKSFLAVRAFLQRLIAHICPKAGKTGKLLFQHLFEDALQQCQNELKVKIEELLTPFTKLFPYSTRSRLAASTLRVELEDKLRNLDLAAQQIFLRSTILMPVCSSFKPHVPTIMWRWIRSLIMWSFWVSRIACSQGFQTSFPR